MRRFTSASWFEQHKRHQNPPNRHRLTHLLAVNTPKLRNACWTATILPMLLVSPLSVFGMIETIISPRLLPLCCAVLLFASNQIVAQTPAATQSPLPVDMQVWSVNQPVSPSPHSAIYSATSLNLPKAPLVASPTANHSADSSGLLAPYQNRAFNMANSMPGSMTPVLESVPAEYVPWWFSDITSAMNGPSNQLSVSLLSLIHI